MEIVDLPVVRADVLAREALAVLKAKQKGAVVAEINSQRYLYRAGDIVKAIRLKGNKTLESIVKGTPLPRIRSQISLGQLSDQAAHWAIASELAASGAELGLLHVDDKRANVVGKSEHSKNLQFTIVVCTCTKDQDHVYLPDELQGLACPLDGAAVVCR